MAARCRERLLRQPPRTSPGATSVVFMPLSTVEPGWEGSVALWSASSSSSESSESSESVVSGLPAFWRSSFFWRRQGDLGS